MIAGQISKDPKLKCGVVKDNLAQPFVLMSKPGVAGRANTSVYADQGLVWLRHVYGMDRPRAQDLGRNTDTYIFDLGGFSSDSLVRVPEGGWMLLWLLFPQFTAFRRGGHATPSNTCPQSLMDEKKCQADSGGAQGK